MERSKSSFATSGASANPFTGSGTVRSMLPTQPVMTNNMNGFSMAETTTEHDPALMNMYGQPVNGIMGLQFAKPQAVPHIESNPDEWLQAMENSPLDDTYTEPFLPMSIAFQPTSTPPMSHYGSSYTSGPTMSEFEMSRNGSMSNQSVTDPLQMMRLNTRSSVNESMPPPDSGSVSASRKRNAPHDEQLAGMFDVSPVTVPVVPMERGFSMDSNLSLGPPPQLSRLTSESVHRRAPSQGQVLQTNNSPNSQLSTPAMGLGASQLEQSVGMERSASMASIKSTQSQRERAKASLEVQIQAGRTQILAPKPKSDSNSAEANGKGTTKSGVEGKLAMPKSTGYQRPKKPKIVCNECNEYPDGFRGDHELRRHKESKHKTMVKKYYCINPEDKGLLAGVKPITPLDKCKHCISGKAYGQYYNACAHLRRAHFTEKRPRASRAKNGKGSDEPVEKRGGKGGGDWPPMNELKKWYEERLVPRVDEKANEATTISDEDEEQDDIVDLPEASDISYLNEHAGQFDDIAACGIGANSDLQIGNNDVYAESFNEFYTTAPVPFDANVMPSAGSANFDLNPATSLVPMGYPHDLPIDLSAYTSASSTATMTPFAASFGQDTQYTQGSSQPTAMAMSQQPSQQDTLGDLDFDSVFPGGC